MAIKRPKGTQDHLPHGSPGAGRDTLAGSFEAVRDTARTVLTRLGASRIDTPIFEEADLVRRSVGGSSDIVRKEMFTVYYFGDHGGYVLRPEGTASVVRAHLQGGLKQLPSPLKLWTDGPMFRAENVQKGRLRQFHQLDYECLGSAEPLADAEAVAASWEIVQALGLRGVSLRLGSIGDREDRANYTAYLRELFTPHREALSEDSQDRLERNPMRILDSKSPRDQELLSTLTPRPMLDFLGDGAAAHFEAVQAFLRELEVPFTVDPTIVRGLDYYGRTAWELYHGHIGAQGALGGGGRYDGLARELGGGELPAVGFALGIERLLLAMEAEGLPLPEAVGPALYLAALDVGSLPQAAALARQARASGSAELAYRPLKPAAAFRDAERRGARFVVLIGSDERQSRQLQVKDTTTREQHAVSMDGLAEFLRQWTE